MHIQDKIIRNSAPNKIVLSLCWLGIPYPKSEMLQNVKLLSANVIITSGKFHTMKIFFQYIFVVLVIELRDTHAWEASTLPLSYIPSPLYLFIYFYFEADSH